VCAPQDGAEGAVRDAHFQDTPLEFYMRDHAAAAEPDGRWRAGSLLKKCVSQLTLGARAAFTVEEEVASLSLLCVSDWCLVSDRCHVTSLSLSLSLSLALQVTDKHGNKPFWGAGPIVLDIQLVLVDTDVDINGDAGVVKHKTREGQVTSSPPPHPVSNPLPSAPHPVGSVRSLGPHPPF